MRSSREVMDDVYAVTAIGDARSEAVGIDVRLVAKEQCRVVAGPRASKDGEDC